MAKSLGFKKRFPHTTIFLVLALAIAVPFTVWSVNNASTNIYQQAASNKTGGSSSLNLVLVSDENANGIANYKDTVTFNVITTQTDYPYVSLLCYQNNTLVYSAAAGFYDSYPWPGSRNMPLYSSRWVGGAADCTATLDNQSKSKRPYATLQFHVSP